MCPPQRPVPSGPTGPAPAIGDNRPMQYGIVITAGDPLAQADLAAEAEAAGWDGVFTYDAIAIGEGDMYDPWVVLAAMAMRTERVRLGAMVFAPAGGGRGSSPGRR